MKKVEPVKTSKSNILETEGAKLPEPHPASPTARKNAQVAFSKVEEKKAGQSPLSVVAPLKKPS